MAIPDEDVAQVRAVTDIVALIGEHGALKRQGRRWVGLCPFHAEKTPSFSVNAEEGFYYCFGCQASGDAISFVRAMEHLDFVDAVRFLADRAGVSIREDVDGGPERKRRTELFEAMERAVAWYHDRLLSSADAGAARDYLRSRGYDGATVRRFRLGWAPDDWDALSKGLGLSERVLTGTGLGFVNRRGRHQDSFRARIVFPICDPSGRPVALGGRVLPGRGAGADGASSGRGPEPKYKNSQETAIYSKRRTLYGLNWAKQDVVAKGEVVVCEGYTDVIGFFQAGVPRAVATCGTALAEEHFKLLRNFGKRIVLAYDADAAGQTATSRVYEWERRHEVDVAVAALPAGSDPGDLARSDPEALMGAVTKARPFLQFRVDRVFEAADLSSAEGRAHAADAALRAIAEHPDDLVRDQYVMQVADRCRLDPARVRERLEQERRHPTQKDGGVKGRADGPDDVNDARRGGSDRSRPIDDGDRGPWDDLEREPGRARSSPTSNSAAQRPGLEALRLAVHHPEVVAERLEEVLFTDEIQRRAFAALAASESLRDAIENSEPEVADLLRRVAVEEPLESDGSLGDPVDAVITQLVRENTRRALGELQAEARTSVADFSDVNAQTSQVKLLLEELDDPLACRAASDRLLAWLIGRGEEDR